MYVCICIYIYVYIHVKEKLFCIRRRIRRIQRSFSFTCIIALTIEHSAEV